MKKFLTVLLLIISAIILSVFLIALLLIFVGVWIIMPGQIQNEGPKDMTNTVITKPYFKVKPMSIEECKKYTRSTHTVRYCDDEKDYWAGAVSQCGGVHNLPTIDQLEYIAKQVYHNGKTGYDGKVAVKYGLPEKLDESIEVLSKNVEFIETGAVGVVKFSNTGYYSCLSGFYKVPAVYAICVENRK